MTKNQASGSKKHEGCDLHLILSQDDQIVAILADLPASAAARSRSASSYIVTVLLLAISAMVAAVITAPICKSMGAIRLIFRTTFAFRVYCVNPTKFVCLHASFKPAVLFGWPCHLVLKHYCGQIATLSYVLSCLLLLTR